MDEKSIAGTVLTFGLLLFGMALVLVPSVTRYRAGQFRPNYRAPLWEATPERRKTLRSCVLRQQPGAPEDHDDVRTMAALMSAGRIDLLLPAGLLVIQLGGLLSNPARWKVIFFIGFTLALAVPIGIVARRVRAGATFLRRYPSEST